MSDHHNFPSRDRQFILPNQSVVVDDFETDRFILDVGGGGEGIVGCLKGSRVVAIDTRITELKETPAGPHKMVMDAGRMAFPDETFATVTAFFTMMFIPESSHSSVMDDIYRVMKRRGKLYLWDIAMPPRADEVRDITAFNLEIRLPDRTLRTAYGVRSPSIVHDMEYYRRLTAAAGFQIIEQHLGDTVIFMMLRKAS